METRQTEMVSRRRHLGCVHQFLGGDDAVAADQSLHLHAEGKEGNQEENRQPPQKEPSHPQSAQRRGARPAIDLVQLGEKCPMQGHFFVERFAQFREGRKSLVEAPHPRLPPPLGQRAIDRLRPAADRPVRQNQMDGFLEVRPGNFRELGENGGVLEGNVVHRRAGGVFPAGHPPAAELTIPVENQQGPRRGRWHSVNFWHGISGSGAATRLLRAARPVQSFCNRNTLESFLSRADSTLSKAR